LGTSKEIEFAIFRKHFSCAEAEDMRQGLEKIHNCNECEVERD
jgi:hypothetical protein